MTTRAVLALGSNLGERDDTLAAGVEQLVDHPQVRLSKMSPMVQTKPVGGPEQPDYLNMVIEVETDFEPYALLAHCQGVEQAHHRRRAVRWGPRTLDVDIITYGDLVCDDPQLTLPHPRAAQRAFVLQPWAWMDNSAQVAGRPVASLAAEADDLPGLKLYERDV
ncbi:2-amino-4-hydroxy-6-hydroxymethyldihydropteridine diphosphokinase [Arthrobacter castelli]|uniref:2-amino-4-hydroxy-6- hydroxymethyldihydropteridine diphosphokinase n=1 Tax=Arthrobacter castelli TaxID=271431 RepID=UPI00041006F3|nr:2-amino-4-hydroxy-6-hydroxymethyldihydropteridine diphosphokinase [Arthrobacter castelli]